MEVALWKKEKPAFSTFPTMFSTLSKKKILIHAAFSLSSAWSFNFKQTKIWSFSIELNGIHVLLSIFLVLTHYQMINFRLFQTERVCRRQFQIWQKWQKVIQMGRKHCGKRRNCLLRAISPFLTVFSKGFVSQGRQKVSLCGNGFKLFPKQQNFGLVQTYSICKWQFKCSSNDNLCLS